MLLSIHTLRESVSSEHSELKQKELEHMPKASHGYGGKFGLQQDRMDKARGFTLIIHFESETVAHFHSDVLFITIVHFRQSTISKQLCVS